MTYQYVEKDSIRKARFTWAFIGYAIGFLAGAGGFYNIAKNKGDTQLESMARDLRLCEERLDRK